MLFSELGLKESSLRAVEKLGFTQPSEIQEQAIPILLKGEVDFIGQAQTGTGKTAAFVLPLLEKIDRSKKGVQCLILAPTRELANQIHEEIKRLSQMDPVKSVAVYGGTSVGGQIRDLKSIRPHIVVGTPGRVMDFIEKGVLTFESTKYVILDEADEMLDMGFFDDVTEIIAQVPEKKIWMFSATMPGPIVTLINRHFCDPVSVKVTKKILTAENIEQIFVVVKGEHQTEALCRILDFNEEMYAIIFTRTKIGAKELTDELNARGYATDSLHGDMSQESRDMTMKKFKEKKISLLVCTDVAARGIDVSDLTHVINFSLPQDNESYVHRIGRTGRGGSKGIALSIITNSEMSRISQIERITKAKINKIQLPKVQEIKDKVLERAAKKFVGFANDLKLEGNTSFEDFAKKFEDFKKEDLLKGVYSYIFENSLKRYLKAQEIELMPRQPISRGVETRNTKGMQRFFINVGRMDGANTGDLIKFLAQTLDIRGNEIGRIDAKEKFAFVELPVAYTDSMLDLKGQMWGQRRISIELAQAAPPVRTSSGPGGYPRRNSGPRSSY